MKRTLPTDEEAEGQASAKRTVATISATSAGEQTEDPPDADGDAQCELHLIPTGEDGTWFTMDYDGHQLFVHPDTKRVCMEIDGDPIGELDLQSGELVLYGEDDEATGATELRQHPTSEVHLAAPLLDEYAKNGLICLKGTPGTWLREGLLSEARQEVEVLLAAGLLSSNRHQQPSSVRTDKVVYLQLSSEEPSKEDGMSSVCCPPACQEVLALIEGFASAIDRRRALSLRRPRRCMAACYDGGGAFYKAHRDNDWDSSTGRWKNSRSATAVFYLNDVDWPATKGGALRCHLGPQTSEGPTDKVLDVLPAGGQLVMFDSKRLLHEVLPTSERRLALTIWFVEANGEADAHSSRD